MDTDSNILHTEGRAALVVHREITLPVIYTLKKIIASLWYRLHGRGYRARLDAVDFGYRVIDEEVTHQHVSISTMRRTMHIAVLGKTGSGKSSLLRHLASQDIESDRGFLYFDLHGDTVPYLLRAINARERKERRHLSDKVILIDPTDSIISVGLNPLEHLQGDVARVGEFVEVLRERWQLDHFGARTDELLRNALHVLSANGLTLIELAPLLFDRTFRALCLRQTDNSDIRDYFRERYDIVSEQMQAAMREPVLNKTSIFTTDPHFRHVIGQERSTFSVREAMDEGRWVLVNLDKGKLGAQALTLGSLILTMFKNAVFSRTQRSLYTFYCDETQSLVGNDKGIETILAEGRKFGVSLVTSHQFLHQHSAEVRTAILSAVTHVLFQLSSDDAALMAQALTGGRYLADRLRNLPRRHCIAKSGHEAWSEVRVPAIQDSALDYTDLLNRSRYTWGRVRTEIEKEIAARRERLMRGADHVLHGWE